MSSDSYSSDNMYSANYSAGAVVLVSGREVAWNVANSIVQTMAKTMDAVLFRQQLQVKKLATFVHDKVSFLR